METSRDQQQDQGQTSAFHRTVWLQVYLPLAIGVILVVALVAVGLAAGGQGGTTTSAMADVVLMALLMPAMLVGVIALAAIVLLAVGVARLIGWLPERSRIVRGIAAQVSQYSDRIFGGVAQVIVVPKSVWGAIGVLWGRRTRNG
jgi:FtsH-binding integral membrane protein